MPESTLDVGRQLSALCAEGWFVDAIDALYADDIVSVECVAMEGHPREQRGIESVRAKNVWWMENHDVHGVETFGPYPHDDRFVVVFKIEVTSKVGPSAGTFRGVRAGVCGWVRRCDR